MAFTIIVFIFSSYYLNGSSFASSRLISRTSYAKLSLVICSFALTSLCLLLLLVCQQTVSAAVKLSNTCGLIKVDR